MPKTITLYCSSSSDIPKKYITSTQALTVRLIQEDFTIVTGGGNGGLMAVVAETCKKLGAKNYGIMPQFMTQNNWTNPDIYEYSYTLNLAERKRQLIERSDILMALPGSMGTWEEFMEALTLKKLHQIHKPLYLYNMHGYYDSFIALQRRAVEEGFMKEEDSQLYETHADLDSLMNSVNNQS